jgi:hypothetical protein
MSFCHLLLENDVRLKYYFIRGENVLVFVSMRLNVSHVMFMLQVNLHTLTEVITMCYIKLLRIYNFKHIYLL